MNNTIKPLPNGDFQVMHVPDQFGLSNQMRTAILNVPFGVSVTFTWQDKKRNIIGITIKNNKLEITISLIVGDMSSETRDRTIANAINNTVQLSFNKQNPTKTPETEKE